MLQRTSRLAWDRARADTRGRHASGPAASRGRMASPLIIPASRTSTSFSWNDSYHAGSMILYDQVWTTGLRLRSSR